VPNAAPFVDGVVFSRGQVVPAVNLRARFGFERVAYDIRTRLIVVQSGGRQVGLIADDGREFLRVPAGSVQPPQDALAGMSGRYIEGIVSVNDRLILILNLTELLNVTEPLVAV
jgi:purine-binding chemotaxis protein CheW